MSGLVNIWRGSRESYNNLGIYDYYTRYSVKENDGTYTEYYGTNPISPNSGQLLPVIDIVETLPSEPGSLKPGDRYLVGSGSTYYIVEITPNPNPEKKAIITPLGTYSVKVINKNMMEYQLVNGKLRTYDIVDCGSY